MANKEILTISVNSEHIRAVMKDHNMSKEYVTR